MSDKAAVSGLSSGTAPAAGAASPADDAGTAGRVAAGATAIASETLFAGAREVLISHHGLVYRLKQTALGKLILTK